MEHVVFRKGQFSSYKVEDWDTPSLLPIGAAAIFAAACGVAGAVIGMNQIWFAGPVALGIDPDVGADLGFELAFAFTGLAFLPARWLEKKMSGR